MPFGRGGRIEVDFFERSTRAMQEILPASLLALFGGARVSVANGLVELRRFQPPLWIVVADPFPAHVAVKRASYCEYPVAIVGWALQLRGGVSALAVRRKRSVLKRCGRYT